MLRLNYAGAPAAVVRTEPDILVFLKAGHPVFFSGIFNFTYFSKREIVF